ncbi:MAG: FUN14 domain-containing protein [Candidatus Bathyarchaeota archaeon]|nr:FUN14 domain-containing protein [Candidatus Bathyarchaeota archaeon]
MSELLPSVGFQVGAGGIGGFIVGYAVKKISKLLAIVVGLFVVALIYLGTQGIISINYDALGESIEGALGLVDSASSWIVSVISLLPFAGSFILGFLLGFKLG